MAGRGWLVGLLSFSQTISLSLLNDKKKEEGRRKKEEEEWERSEKKKWEEEEKIRKKFSVLGCRIILWIFFFFYMRWQLVIGGQKSPPFTHRPKISYSQFGLLVNTRQYNSNNNKNN